MAGTCTKDKDDFTWQHKTGWQVYELYWPIGYGSEGHLMAFD